MKKINIKFKYLILIILIIVASVSYIVPKAIYARAKALEGVDIEAAKVLYKRYISIVPFSNQKADAMFKIASEIVPHENVFSNYKISRARTSFTGDNRITKDIINNALEYYNKIYKYYPNNENYIKAYKRLLDIYIVLGEHHQSRKFIKEGLKSDSKELSYIAKKYSMLYLILDKKYEEAIGLGEELVSEKYNGYVNYDVYWMIGNIYYMKGEFQKAIDNYEKYTTVKFKDNSNYRDKFEHTKDLVVYDFQIKNYNIDTKINNFKNVKSLYNGKSEIYGKVTIDNEPVPFAQIYLKDSKLGEVNSWSTGEKGSCFWTDMQGNYKIPYLSKSEYDVEIQIPNVLLSKYRVVYQSPSYEESIQLSDNESKEYNFSFVKPLKIIEPIGQINPKNNKVKIQWEKVDGAAYYYVNATEMDDPIKLQGSSGTGGISDKITDSSYIINIDILKNNPVGYSTNSQGLVNIGAYFGMFGPGFKIPITVTAYDKNDNVLNCSKAIQDEYKNLSVITMPQGKLLEGDKLLINKKPEEALKSYEKYLKNNPKDIHAMSVLTRLYKIGTRIDFKSEKFTNKDIYKSYLYAKKVHELSGDNSLIKYVFNMINYDVKNKQDYEWAIKEILKFTESELTSVQYVELGDLYLKLKEFNNADRSFEKAISMGNKYVPKYPLVKLYLEQFDDAIKISPLLGNFMYNADEKNFIEGVKSIKSVDKKSESYTAFKEIIESVLTENSSGYRKKYKNLNHKIKDRALNTVMNELRKEYSLDL